MEPVQTPGGGAVLVGKNRNPIAVLFFSVITFGIYWLYWYYVINDEVRRHEPAVRCTPAVALLAQFVPIANFVSHYNTATRIQRMELADGASQTISPLVTFLLLYFLIIGYVVQIQSHLNAHWDSHRLAMVRAERQGLLGARPAALTPAEEVGVPPERRLGEAQAQQP